MTNRRIINKKYVKEECHDCGLEVTDEAIYEFAKQTQTKLDDLILKAQTNKKKRILRKHIEGRWN